MIPTSAWLESWKQKRDSFRLPYNLETYFNETTLFGVALHHMGLGTVSVPTGILIAGDPLAHIRRDTGSYFMGVPKGEFPVTATLVLDEGDCARVAAVKVDFSGTPSVWQEEALVGGEPIDDLDEEEGDYFGFPVDAGLACVMDEKVRDAYCDFVTTFARNHPGANLYDDYFADIFAASYRQSPEYQREGGDWITWTVPGTDYSFPIFQSGFGDGIYPAYYGFDREGNICSFFVQFIDIELAYSDEE